MESKWKIINFNNHLKKHIQIFYSFPPFFYTILFINHIPSRDIFGEKKNVKNYLSMDQLFFTRQKTGKLAENWGGFCYLVRWWYEFTLEIYKRSIVHTINRFVERFACHVRIAVFFSYLFPNPIVIPQGTSGVSKMELPGARNCKNTEKPFDEFQ